MMIQLLLALVAVAMHASAASYQTAATYTAACTPSNLQVAPPRASILLAVAVVVVVCCVVFVGCFVVVVVVVVVVAAAAAAPELLIAPSISWPQCLQFALLCLASALQVKELLVWRILSLTTKKGFVLKQLAELAFRLFLWAFQGSAAQLTAMLH